MLTRRNFVSTLACGTAALAASSALSSALAASGISPALPQQARTQGGKYRPPFRFGLGGAPIGGSVGIPMGDDAARQTLENAWQHGARFYDTSPWYGLGLSERRFGGLLHDRKREDYVIASKVGRLLTADADPPKTSWANPDSFAYHYDYTAAGTRRSVEDSLQRLGISSLDIVFIHDLSPDNADMKDDWEEHFAVAAKGAMPELTRMREEGIIKAWGFGVNTLPPILKALEQADPDIFLAACQYTLMVHDESLEKLFPACERRGVSVVVGSPLNNGFLTGRDRYNYGKSIPAGFKEKRARMNAVAQAHGIDLRTAALQFCAAPAAVSAVIPGARQPHQVVENIASMSVKIPAGFWAEMKREKLIAEQAPVPA